MLKKKQRLSRKEFEEVLKKGKRAKGDNLTAVMLPCNSTKCGLVVSKKTSKKAPMRNKIRRQIYSILGENIESIDNKHVVIITYPTAVNLTFFELKKEIEKILKT